MTHLNFQTLNLNDITMALEDLKDEKNYQKIIDIFEKISNYLDVDPFFLDKNKHAAIILFNEAYPRIFNFIVSTKNYQTLFFWISIFIRMCNFMALCRMFLPIKKYLPTLFDLIESININENHIYSFGYQTQSLINYINNDCNLNIYSKFLIDQLVQVQLTDVQIIPMFINDIPFHKSFSEISDVFNILNHVFPNVNRSVLDAYELEFARFKFSIDDPRFNDPTSINLTKAMSTCSPKYAPLHFDNLIKFIKKDNKQAKKEIVSFLKKTENLRYLPEKIVDNIDLLLSKMRDEEQYLNEITSIILSNNIISTQIFFQKVGFDLVFNLAFFEFGKERYTKEIVSIILDSEPFCSQTVDFGFKIIDHKIDLMPNISNFLRKSLFSPFFKDEMMNTISFISKIESNRQILLDSINNYEIQNQQEYEIILQILILLKPTTSEYNYDNFVNEILDYTDSLFILPFLKNNQFIPLNSIDIEFLISYSIFNEEFSEFLFKNFSETLNGLTEFFLTFSVEDDRFNSKKAYGRFLFNLFKKGNSIETRLLWESVIRLEDSDEEVHLIAQKMINENPSKSQQELIEKVGDGYSKYFINFDFSNFSEISSEENGNFLIFNRPQQVSEDSFFYYSSQIRYALNHSNSIKEQDLLELFEFRSNDASIDAISLHTAFDACIKMDINFPYVEESLNFAFEVKYKIFIDKLINYIINSEGEVITFNRDLLNKISIFDEKMTIELIKNKKVTLETVYDYLSNYQNKQANLVLSSLDIEIPIYLLNQIVYSKQNFINFVESNRIKNDEVLPFIYSLNFPQFYRTKEVISSVFNWIKSNPILLLNFLKSQKWKEPKIDEKGSLNSKSFIPFVKSSKYYHVYLAFSRIVSHFDGFEDEKISDFLSNLIYSRQGDEDSCLCPPINEVKNNLESLRMNQIKQNDYAIDHFVDKFMSILPVDILKEFEFLYFVKKSRNSSNYEINHDFYLKVFKKSISEEIEKISLLNHPSILMFNIRQQKEFIIEKSLTVNGRLYFLSSVITNSNLFVPCKVHKKSVNNGFSKWSNGEKVHVNSIEGEPVFIFYQLYEIEEDENGLNSNEFFNIQRIFKKIHSTKYTFNLRAILCESLEKANYEWNEWKCDQNLFEIATILLCEVGYCKLFKFLSTNSEFSEFFFKSNWEEKYPIQNIDTELITLANLFPQRDELLPILFKSIKEKNRQHFASIILSSFELNTEFIEKLISIISPSFDGYENVLLNYFMKETTTNEFLLKNDKLAEFVLSRIDKQKDSFSILQRLLNPMTDKLFITCLKCLSKPSVTSLLSTFSESTSRILLALAVMPHKDDLAIIFCQTKPILSSILDDDDDDDNKSNINEFRKNLRWVEYALSSQNQRIRNHTFSIFGQIFNKTDSDLLTDSFEGAIAKSLFQPYFEEVKDFIEKVSGIPFKKSSDFTASIYNRLFNRTYLHKNQKQIVQYIATLPAPPKQMIPSWKCCVDQSEGDFFVEMGLELILASIRCCYEPQPSYFHNIIYEVAERHDYISIESLMKSFSLFIDDQNVHNYFRMIIEFEKWIPYYIHLINNIMINVKEFRESQLIIMAIILPHQVIAQKKCMDIGFNGFNSNGDVYLSSLEIAINALEMVIEKKAFIKITNIAESDILTSRLYALLVVKYFQAGIDYVFQNYLGLEQLQFGGPIQEWRVNAAKLYLKYMSLCSIVFPNCLKSFLKFIDKNRGLTYFGVYFQSLQTEWADFCCEIFRNLLSDIRFNSLENKKKAVRTINLELCTQLFHYNSAEKSFLRFLIGVLKNDQLRIETKLKCNNQIFNVFRNEFVMYIEDVAMFIDLSLQKYPDFFNDKEIRTLILNLQIYDQQIIQKLKIILNIFEQRGDKMKELIEEVFPKIEEIANTDVEVDDELGELLNAVFEQSLVIYSS